MKKILFPMVCLVLCGLFLAGCSDSGEPFAQKSYTAGAEQLSGVCIDVRDRQVEVTPSADGQIHISYFENSREYYDISVSDGKVLTMTAVSGKEWPDYIGGKPSEDVRKISLQLPDNLLSSLKIATTNEAISVAPLSVTGEISLSANGGDVLFDALQAGSAITLHAKNGDISGVIAGSYDDYAISCTVKKGESNLPSDSGGKEEGSKKLSVSANNGDVAIDFQ